MSTDNARGFTLIETLIAMVILTVALVSMAELMAITLRMQALSKNGTSAVRLAQSKIDELVNLGFTGATAGLTAVGGSLTSNDAGYFDTPTSADGYVDALSGGVTRRWQISAIVDPLTGVTEPKIRRLTVRIVPRVTDQRTRPPIDLTTIIRSP